MSDTPTLENRSEIVFLYDAEDCNPNGNPLSANDKPRIDETTGEAVVTDVRLKRYIRDQLDDDGFGIYVRNPSKAPYEDVPGRDQLFRRVTDLSDEEIEEMDPTEAAEAFLDNAVDVRYFGATCSFSEEFRNQLGDEFPGQFIGPVQFEHARSMHTIVTKTESKQLSTVVASEEGDEQGTFATDNRLEYALVKFHGVVNENAAKDTNLSHEDVERLDRLCWRSLKNQTLTRSKMGHQPRLYLRVEYATDDYHAGSLDDGIQRADADETDGTDYRNITDVTLDVTGLLEALEADAEHIDTVHVKLDEYVSIQGVEDDPEAFYDTLGTAVGAEKVNVLDIYEQ
jgi:CRISPR-associated protein Csh2